MESQGMAMIVIAMRLVCSPPCLVENTSDLTLGIHKTKINGVLNRLCRYPDSIFMYQDAFIDQAL